MKNTQNSSFHSYYANFVNNLALKNRNALLLIILIILMKLLAQLKQELSPADSVPLNFGTGMKALMIENIVTNDNSQRRQAALLDILRHIQA